MSSGVNDGVMKIFCAASVAGGSRICGLLSSPCPKSAILDSSDLCPSETKSYSVKSSLEKTEDASMDRLAIDMLVVRGEWTMRLYDARPHQHSVFTFTEQIKIYTSCLYMCVVDPERHACLDLRTSSLLRCHQQAFLTAFAYTDVVIICNLALRR